MKITALRFLLFIFLSALLLTPNSFPEDTKLDLSKLQGDWLGVGSYTFPFTTMTASIEGEAKFIYDSTNNYLRTFITADNLLFSYSDSGHLQIVSSGDSAVWEIWNGWGHHFRYRGVVEGTTITGSRRRGKLKYDVYVNVVNYDSIDCRLMLTDEDGETSEQASCYFKRVDKKN